MIARITTTRSDTSELSTDEPIATPSAPACTRTPRSPPMTERNGTCGVPVLGCHLIVAPDSDISSLTGSCALDSPRVIEWTIICWSTMNMSRNPLNRHTATRSFELIRLVLAPRGGIWCLYTLEIPSGITTVKAAPSKSPAPQSSSFLKL